MKQIFQDMSSGQTIIIEAPAPYNGNSTLLIATTATLVSAGTERMLVDFGKASYIDKARQQPEKVRMVIGKIKTDGLLTTYEAVKSKLEQPIPLGYCNVGKVIDVGNEIVDIKIGDRVISNGPHAEIVKIKKNLFAKVPDTVDDESAVFTVIGSIALQGIRLANPTIGENFVVIGVGLIGLMAIQLLRSNGCNVLAIDINASRLELAKKFGAEICNTAKGEDPVIAGLAFSKGYGTDGVIIAATTKTSEPVSQAAKMSRKRGRIVLVGVTGLELNRSEFYEKELQFQVSCSYGPGRYDPVYEEKGNDYPHAYVRWTEKRNFEAILDLMASGRLDVKPLITHRYLFENSLMAYDTLTSDSSVLGIVLKYSSEIEKRQIKKVILNKTELISTEKPVIGFVGAGNYASRILIPAFNASDAILHTIVTDGGLSGVIHGKKAGFKETTTDIDDMLENSKINTVVIVTRHNTHANIVIKSIEAGKHVFVEKPLAITIEDLNRIENIFKIKKNQSSTLPLLMLGYNRRFSPHIIKMKELLSSIIEPKSFIMTMNAGSIPSNHWTQDRHIGGGRIIGEACHMIDLMRFMSGSPIISVQSRCMGKSNIAVNNDDKVSITLGFEDGSFGTILYLANGSANFPKERIEVFASGRVLQLDNYRKLKGYGWPGFRNMNLWKQDKGQNKCVKSFLDAIEKGENSPIPLEEIFEVARVSLEIADMLTSQ